MGSQALTGGFENASHASALAFRAALDALARPGTIHRIVGGQAPAPLSKAAATLILTLCDPETPVFLAGDCDVAPVRDWVTFHTGAPLVGPSKAVFAIGTWAELNPIDRFAIGSAQYPDRSATLIVETADLRASGACLTGPGIRDSAAFDLPDVAAFQRNAALFPLGVDFVFTSGTRVAALPRSTKITWPEPEEVR